MSLILAALSEPVQIEVNGDEFRATELIPPGLLALAAIVAAGLAAFVALRNLTRQLDHDRDMRERDAIRGTVEDAVETTSRGMRLLLRLSGLQREVDAYHQRLGEAQTMDERHQARTKHRQTQDAIMDALTEVTVMMTDNLAALARLRLRFRPDDAVPQAFERWSDDLDELMTATDFARDAARTAEEAEAHGAKLSQVGSTWRAFIATARDWANEPVRR